MSTTSQNPIVNNQINDVNNNNNNNEQIVVMQQAKDGTSENFTNIKFEKEFENAFTQPFDINTLYNSENNSNNPLSFNKKELDDVFNQGFRYVRKSFLVEGNNNLDNNMVNNNNFNNAEEENIFETKKSGMSGGPGSSNNAINSPFGYAQNKNQKMSSTNNQKSNKKNLTQRYAIGYQNNK